MQSHSSTTSSVDTSVLPVFVSRYGVTLMSALAAIFGGSWLVAWACGIPQRWAATPVITMKTNMAVGALLAGAALVLLQRVNPSFRRRVIGALAASLVFLIGMLTVYEHLFDRNLGIDQLLLSEPIGAAGVTSPNRMGPPGAFCLMLIGTGLLSLASGRRRSAPYFGVAVCVISLVPAIGYLYGANAFYGNAYITGIALPTIPTLMALGFGLVLACKESGPMVLLLRQDAGGALLRHLLPATVLVPVVLGYLRTIGERAGLYDALTGRALLVMSVIFVFSALLWISAARLSRSAVAAKQATEALRHLSAIVESSDDAIVGKSLDGRITSWNRGAERLYGYPAKEVLGRSIDILLPTNHPDELTENLKRVARGERIEQYETVRRRRDGSLIEVSVKISPILDSGGTVIGAASTAHDISDRKRAELALRESEGRLRLFIEHAPAALAMFDRDMRYLAASRRWFQDYGLKTDIIGRSHYDVFSEIPERWKQVHRRALAGEVLREDDDAFIRDDGSVQWIKWAIHPWHDAAGEVGGILIATEDVTSSIQIREALRKSEARLSAALDHLAEGVVIATEIGEVFYWNPAAQEMHSIGTEDKGRRPLKDFTDTFELRSPDGTLLSVEEWPMSRILRGEKIRKLELCLHRLDQGWDKILSYSGEMLHTGSGEHLVYLSIYDLTEQRKAEQALRRSEQRLRGFYDSGMVGVIYWNSNGEIVEANDKFLKMLGYTRADVATRSVTCHQLTPPEYRAADEVAMAELRATGLNTPYEKECIRNDGTRVPVVIGAAMLDSTRREGVAFVLDNTERKRAEQALIRSEKLASIGRMAATVAHEINNPLAMIMNSVYIASLDDNLSERARNSLATAEQELERVAHLTRQTLGFYRENAAPVDVDITGLVQDVVQLYAPKFMHRDIAVECEHGSKLQIHAVPGEIRQVVSNIIANAIDASPRGGRVRIRTSRAPINGSCCVRLTFADTGEGIAPENLNASLSPSLRRRSPLGQAWAFGLPAR